MFGSSRFDVFVCFLLVSRCLTHTSNIDTQNNSAKTAMFELTFIYLRYLIPGHPAASNVPKLDPTCDIVSVSKKLESFGVVFFGKSYHFNGYTREN